MIIEFLITFVLQSILLLTAWFEPVTELPFIDSYLVTGINGYKTLAIYMPFLNTILIAFSAYMVFIVGMKLFRMLPIVGKVIDTHY